MDKIQYIKGHSKDCCTLIATEAPWPADGLYNWFKCQKLPDAALSYHLKSEFTTGTLLKDIKYIIKTASSKTELDVTTRDGWVKVLNLYDKDAIPIDMPTAQPIPDDLLKKWSLTMAKDLKHWLNTEHRKDLEWEVSAGPSGANYEPNNQVTQNVRLGFTFSAKYKGKPGIKTAEFDISNDFSIKKISKRIIKKLKK
jgi:hypothetical protein